MAFIQYNPNPQGNRVGDCTIRAISKLLNQDWNTTYIELCLQGYILKDMPSANNIWGSYLLSKCYVRTKRTYQLYNTDKEILLSDMSELSTEISNLISLLLQNSETEQERDILKTEITNVLETL